MDTHHKLMQRWSMAVVLTMICLVPQVIFSQPKPANQAQASYNRVTNFDKNGRQTTRFSTVGDAVDAHDGEIALFNGIYYLYGTSYDCGFEWGNKNAPFCGFKTYSSTDMVNWTDLGFMFDAQTTLWQTRCNGNTYGCFRPHVVYNTKTGLYVLWINVYDNVSGYRVFTSKTPAGPFAEVPEPTLSVNSQAPAAGLNNGDHDTFVDDDGTAYLAFTDWRTKGTIVIEKLSADYLTGTGEHFTGITTGKTEAPGMFKRNGIYYIVYSDPNCGYCSGTGTSYRTARSPLGPWSEGKKISDNSCGGQPSFVSTLKLDAETIYLYGSDLWNNAAKNEALANYYWAPLMFATDGSINPMTCDQAFRVPATGSRSYGAGDMAGFRIQCDISKSTQRAQSFQAARTGTLDTVYLTTFKTGYPDAGLQIDLYKADKLDKPVGGLLATAVLPTAAVGWSAKNLPVPMSMAVTKGAEYCMVIHSAAVTGCFGYAYRESGLAAGNESMSNDGGLTFTTEKNRLIKFQVVIKEK